MPRLSDKLKPASNDSKSQAAKIEDRRVKYEGRGFLFYGAIPLGRFHPSQKPFATNQRRRNDQSIGARKRKQYDIETSDDIHRKSVCKDLGQKCIGSDLTSQNQHNNTVSFTQNNSK